MNPVTKKLARTKTGIATQQMQLAALDHYSPALHMGEIDTGYQINPELSQASDRTFGTDSDFNMGEMDAFEFTPQGERFENMWQFYEQFKNGRMALGRRFILHKLFFSNCYECFLSKSIMTVPDIKRLVYSVDPFKKILHEYWTGVSCPTLYPGKYVFLGMKKYDEDSKKHTPMFILFFQDSFGKQIAVVNANMNGMQALSPFDAETAIRGVTNMRENSNMYLANQADVANVYNSQYTKTGTRFGKDNLPKYNLNTYNRPGYDESAAYGENTFRSINRGGYKQFNIQPGAISRPFPQMNNYW